MKPGAFSAVLPSVLAPNLKRTRIASSCSAGADFLVLDSAHGHSEGIINAVYTLKNMFPDAQMVAGNIATAEAAEDLIAAGADA